MPSVMDLLLQFLRRSIVQSRGKHVGGECVQSNTCVRRRFHSVLNVEATPAVRFAVVMGLHRTARDGKNSRHMAGQCILYQARFTGEGHAGPNAGVQRTPAPWRVGPPASP